MDFWRSISGMVTVKLTSACNEAILSAITFAGIEIYEQFIGDDELSVMFIIRRTDLKKATTIAIKRGAKMTVIRKIGLYWWLKSALGRPVLITGLVIIMLAVIFLPTRVFFFRIEGNEKIPSKLILEKCGHIGISFGAQRVHVRSERVKNALLEAIPELKWAGINTSGCVATISVRERSEASSVVDASRVSSIVAARDGIISSCTATKGNALCKIGQVVRSGQILISGYTDCGISIRAEQAQGEIYAQTQRKADVILPDIAQDQSANTSVTKKYSLIIGKKRINLFKGSGISDTSCDKMYSENYITLPGGFQLPIALVTETVYTCTLDDATIDENDAHDVLTEFSQSYLRSQMIAGEILDAREDISVSNGCYILSGKYTCNEMIGFTQDEEIIRPDGKHD